MGKKIKYREWRNTRNTKNKEKSRWKIRLHYRRSTRWHYWSFSFADTDFFQNIRKLLIFGATSPIWSTEAERAASVIRRLKTPYWSTIGDKREIDLNLLQLQRISNTDIQSVVQMFIRRCTIRKLTIVKNKRTNVCKTLNM